MQRRFLTVLALAAVVCLPVTAMAATTLTAGDHSFPVGSGNVTFDILASGNDPLQGVDIMVMTGTNGGDLTASTPDAPTLVSVDLVGAGTIFNPNNNTQGDVTNGTNIYQGGTATNSGLIASADTNGGILAHVTIDITGWGAGVYPLWVNDSNPLSGGGLTGTVLYTTGGAALQLASTNGSITLTAVPEPSSIVLGLFAAAGMAAVVIRRRRAA